MFVAPVSLVKDNQNKKGCNTSVGFKTQTNIYMEELKYSLSCLCGRKIDETELGGGLPWIISCYFVAENSYQVCLDFRSVDKSINLCEDHDPQFWEVKAITKFIWVMIQTA